MASTVEVLVDAFQKAGTPFIVGHPGGESVELMDAARRAGMRFLFIKQETAGAMLAATWGEITGSPGVCMSTCGPGTANMANGIAHAWMDRAPLFAVTGQYSHHVYGTGLRQRLDQGALMTPITKYTMSIDAKTVRHQIRRAIRHATSQPPGPVHIDLPEDQSQMEAGDMIADTPLRQNVVETGPDKDTLKEPLAMLAAAKKPVVIVGMGVYWCRAAEEFVAFAEKLGAPVLTTTKCKGAIPEDHALRAGCIIGGLIERKLINDSDLIVTVGLDAVELQPKPWPYKLPVLTLASTPNLDAVIPSTQEVIGDLKPLLARLTEWANDGSGWGEAAAKDFRNQVTKALDVKTKGMSTGAALMVARAVMPRDTIATCDAGASRLLVVQKWDTYGPQEFLTSNGLATMGYAIPGAMAARMAHPDKPVIAFTGDGGFYLAVAELQTAAVENLPIIVMVFDDSEIALIRVKQEVKGFPTFGVGLGGVDWVKIAQGFGADGYVADNEHALGDALKSALKSKRSSVVVAKIDSSCYVEQFNALREV
ncbi:MAG: thiamine pyrophosphate-binding protein [Rhodospirillales bacterium]